MVVVRSGKDNLIFESNIWPIRLPTGGLDWKEVHTPLIILLPPAHRDLNSTTTQFRCESGRDLQLEMNVVMDMFSFYRLPPPTRSEP